VEIHPLRGIPPISLSSMVFEVREEIKDVFERG
jgi:hypothetical protein